MRRSYAVITYRVENGVTSVKTAYAPDDTWIMVVGRTSAINTGFVSAVEAEGWRWEEAPDVLALFAQPLPLRTVVVVPIPAFTTTSYAMIRQLTTALGLPVVVFSAEYHPEIVNATL